MDYSIKALLARSVAFESFPAEAQLAYSAPKKKDNNYTDTDTYAVDQAHA